MDFAISSGVRSDMLQPSVSDLPVFCTISIDFKRCYSDTAAQCAASNLGFLPFGTEASSGGAGTPVVESASTLQTLPPDQCCVVVFQLAADRNFGGQPTCLGRKRWVAIGQYPQTSERICGNVSQVRVLKRLVVAFLRPTFVIQTAVSSGKDAQQQPTDGTTVANETSCKAEKSQKSPPGSDSEKADVNEISPDESSIHISSSWSSSHAQSTSTQKR